MNPHRSRVAAFARWLPALVCMAVIFGLSSRTGGELDGWLPWFQRWIPSLASFDPVHYVAYFALALTLAFGFGFRRLNGRRGLLVIALCVLYGASDEWHQFYVPRRSSDPMDLLHDGIGAVAAVLCIWLWRRLAPGSRIYRR